MAVRTNLITQEEEMAWSRVPGQCYSLAAMELIYHWERYRDNRLTLVHAIVKDSYGPGYVEHAWCEIEAVAEYEDGTKGPCMVVVDDTQLDPKARLCPAYIYYEQAQVTTIQRYTFHEWVACARFFECDGPFTRERLANMSVRTKALPCPSCRKTLSGHAEINGSDSTPSTGDVTVCAHCGALLTYEDARMRELLVPEVLGLSPEVRGQLFQARRLIKLVRVQRKGMLS